MKQLGDFILEESLQLGRWSEVWRARWSKAPAPQYRLVALKVLRIEFITNKKLIKRFNNEIRTTSSLQHPNVAAPMTWGILDDQRRYFATQFIAGSALSAWTEQGPLPTNFVLSILGQIANGLDYVHSKGVVHRDIKPDNILITPEGVPFLVDFSIALSREVARLTQYGELVGTVAYMAPEMISGDTISPLSDIYSLGMLAYQMLTGRVPFEGNPIQVTYQHLNVLPAPPSTINPALPPAVDHCLAWALSKEPKQRPASATFFVQNLESAIKTNQTGPWTPVQPPPPSNFWPVLLAAFVALMFIIIIFMFLG